MSKEKTSKKSHAIVMAGVVVLSALGGAVAHELFVPAKVVEVPVEGETVIEYLPSEVEYLPSEVITETEFVEVDNGDMAFVLSRLEDMDVITDAEEIVEELKAEDAAIKGAFSFVEEEKDELFDMLEEADIVRDEDDVEVIRSYDDFEDVEIIKSDFDDEEYKFNLEFKVEDTDKEVKHKILVKVVLEDGEYEIVKVSKI